MPATPLDDAITTIGLGGPGISWGEVDDKGEAEAPASKPQQVQLTITPGQLMNNL